MKGGGSGGEKEEEEEPVMFNYLSFPPRKMRAEESLSFSRQRKKKCLLFFRNGSVWVHAQRLSLSFFGSSLEVSIKVMNYLKLLRQKQNWALCSFPLFCFCFCFGAL